MDSIAYSNHMGNFGCSGRHFDHVTVTAVRYRLRDVGMRGYALPEMICQCGLWLLRLGCPACAVELSAGLGLVGEREMLESAGHGG